MTKGGKGSPSWYDAASWDVGLEGGSWTAREAGGLANETRRSGAGMKAEGAKVRGTRARNRQQAITGIRDRARQREAHLAGHIADSGRREQNLRSSTARNYAMNVNPYASSNMLASTQVALDTETAANKQRLDDLQIQRDLEKEIAEGTVSDAHQLQEIGTEAGFGLKEYNQSIQQINADITEGGYHGKTTDDEEGMMTLVSTEYNRLMSLGLDREAEQLLRYYTQPGQPGYQRIYEQ